MQEYVTSLVADFVARLPRPPATLPDLKPEQVQRFVEKNSAAWADLGRGRVEAAEASFHEQIAISPENPDPYVGLALVAAGRGRDRLALGRLRSAIVRGYRDLGRMERAEPWRGLRDSTEFLYMQDALPALEDAEQRWGHWSAYRSTRCPPSLAGVRAERARWDALLTAAAPALGEHLTKLWHSVIDRVAAARLEAYVAQRREAADAREAHEALLDLYSHGALLRWEVLSPDDALSLGRTAGELLRRFPESPARDFALVCSALARNSERTKKRALTAASAQAIRDVTLRLVRSSSDPSVVALAAEGLVRTEAETRGSASAAAAFQELRSRFGSTGAVVDAVRGRLGTLALMAGGLPDVAMPLLDGATLKADDLRGRVTVVDFWATWCRPCLEGLPRLRRLQARSGDRVAVVGISLDRAEDLSAERLREWIARQAVPGRQVFDGESWDSKVVQSYGVTEIPFTVVVGTDGSVVAVNPRGKELEKVVRAALAKTTEARAR